jgi:putative ABC transport system permease protein
MNKLDIVKLASQNLWRRKMRTFLTVLGVLIGTASIVVMLSLGIGLSEIQRQDMERWGSLSIIEVHRGMIFDPDGEPVGESKELDDTAVEEINEIPGVSAVSPRFNLYGEVRMGKLEGDLSLIGLVPELMPQLEFKAASGRLLQAGDSNVMVVGQQVIQNLYDENERRAMEKGTWRYDLREEKDPQEMLDQRLAFMVHNNYNFEKKRNYNFLVVGILDDEYGEHAWQAYAPIEDLKKIRRFVMEGMERNQDHFGPTASKMEVRDRENKRNKDVYDSLLVRTESLEKTSQVAQMLRDSGYNCWSIADNLEGFEKTSRTIQAVLGGIGAITLLVAAIGITNTMIMSIYERTKEIGVMKVIGATFGDVYSLFLTEAGLIGLFGGIWGLGLSYGLSYLINQIINSHVNQGMPLEEIMQISLIPSWLALFALLFSLLIGVIAGLYPAHRAVKLSPLKAIRNE